MSAKKLALELSINIKKGDITLEELNEQLAEAKAQMKEMGDDGSDEFKALGVVVDEAEAKVKSFNDELKNTKKGLDKTADAQKNAAKGSEVFKKGLKAVGTAFKALGIGIVVGALKFLFDALSQNQKVMNAVNTAVEAISIVMSKVVGTITDVVTQVYESSNGFEGLKNVVMGLLTLAITPLKLQFFAIKLTIQQAQLAWEKSFFGGGDKDKIKQLTADVKETKESIKDTGKEALKAGKDVVTNFGKAASEIGQVVTKTTEGIQKISVKGAIEQAKTNVKLTNSAEIAAAKQQLLIEKYDRQAEQLRQIRDEERNSIEVRKEANDKLAKVLDDQEKAMKANANLQLQAAQAQRDKVKNTENEVAVIAALAEVKAVEASVEGFRSEQKVNDLALDREKQEQLKAISDSEAALSYERKKFNAEQIEDKLEQLKKLKSIEEERAKDEIKRLQEVLDATEKGTQAETDAIIALNEFKETSRQANAEAGKAVVAEIETQADKVKKNIEELKKMGMETLNSLVDFALVSSAAEEERLSHELEMENQRQQEKEKSLQKTIENAEKGSQAEMDAQARLDAFKKQSLEGGTEAQIAAEAALEKQREKSFKLNQQVAIGRAIIDTSQNAIKAYGTQFIPGEPSSLVRGALAAAAVVAQGGLQIATIKKQKYRGSGGTVPSPTSPSLGSGDVGTQPNIPNFNAALSKTPTTKVIVTETDIRKATRDIDGIYNKAVVVE